MAYSDLPKLAEIQKAIKAVTDANKKYTDALAKVNPSKDALKNAQKARADAEKKLQQVQAAFDSGEYLKNNKTYTDAVKALSDAEKKLNDAIKYRDDGKFLKDSKAYNDAVKAMQDAEKKLNDLRTYRDTEKFLNDNTAFKNAQKAVTDAEKARDTAQRNLDNATDKNRVTLEKAFTKSETDLNNAYKNLDKARRDAENLADSNIRSAETAFNTAQTKVDTTRTTAEKAAEKSVSDSQKAFDKSQTDLDRARASAETAYQNNQIKTAQTAYDKSVTAYDTAESTLQTLNDSVSDFQNQRQDRMNEAAGYAQSIKDGLGGITTRYDANLANNLIKEFNSLVDKTDIGDFEKQIMPMFKNVDAMKLASIPTVNIPKANPDYFPNIDPVTKMPILDQGALDSVLNKYGGNTLDKDQYRDNYNKFGWNVKSDGSSVARGAAIFGLNKVVSPMGGGISYTGDFNKAAKEANVDISGLKTNEEKYNAINEATKDFYVVANSLDRGGAYAGQNTKSPHAAILFKADGSGNLMPVATPNGKVAATYFDAVGNSVAGWRGQLAELAPIITVASFAFLPGLSQALGSQIASTAVGQAIGTAASNAVANAAISAGMAAITGGDVGRAALTAGLGTVAVDQATKIANTVVGQANVQAIADAAKMTRGQVEKIIAGGVAEGLSAAATGGDILESMAKNVAAGFTSEAARNLAVRSVLDADQSIITKVSDTVASLTNLGTQAALNGQDPIEVMSIAAPSIILSSSGAEVEERGDIEERSFLSDRQASYKQVLDAFGAEPKLSQEMSTKWALQDVDQPQIGEKLAKAVKFDAAGNVLPDDAENWSLKIDVLPDDIEQTLAEQRIGSLFSTGTSDPNAKLKSVFGTGASGGTADDFVLVARDQGEKDEDIVTWLETELTKAPETRKQEIQNTIQKIKDKKPLTKTEQFNFLSEQADANQKLAADKLIYGEDYIPPDALGKFIQYLQANPPAAEVGAGEIPTSPTQTSTTPTLTPTGGGIAGISYAQASDLAKKFFKDANKIPTQRQLDEFASKIVQVGNAQASAAGETPGGTGTEPGGTAGPGTAPGPGPGAGPGGTGGAGTQPGTQPPTPPVTPEPTPEKPVEEAQTSQQRQQQYQNLMGIASLPTGGGPSTVAPASVFYYGKEFGSPTQKIGPSGEMVQEPYRPLSVTTPGKEAPWMPDFQSDQEVASGKGTDENDVSSLIQSIMSQGDETSLNDILGILGRG